MYSITSSYQSMPKCSYKFSNLSIVVNFEPTSIILGGRLTDESPLTRVLSAMVLRILWPPEVVLLFMVSPSWISRPASERTFAYWVGILLGATACTYPAILTNLENFLTPSYKLEYVFSVYISRTWSQGILHALFIWMWVPFLIL